MVGVVDILRTIEGAPLRTVRFNDIKPLGRNVWRVLDDLVEHGALTRLAHGVYTSPPGGRDGRTWKPDLETGGLAIATARHGNRQAILMGIGAARHWGAIPRALGNTTVAVPSAGRAPITTGSGTVHFIPRNLDRLAAALEQTELGPALVTTRAQTLFDLLLRPHQGEEPEAAAEAARNLRPQVGASDFDDVIFAATRSSDAVRAIAAELAAR